jgi:hypothetical protein
MYNTTALPEIDQEIDVSTKLATEVETQAQVIVHCHFLAQNAGDGYRIWPTTFLTCQHSGQKSKLIHAENVCYYPQWQFAQKPGWYSFTLVFESLPSTCTLFDLAEEIPEAGAFKALGIRRNKSDVYNVEF